MNGKELAELLKKVAEKAAKETAREIISIIKRYNHKETMIGLIEKKYNIDIDLEDE